MLQIVNLKKAASDDEKRRREDKKQAEVYESHSKFMKSKVINRYFNVNYSIQRSL